MPESGKLLFECFKRKKSTPGCESQFQETKIFEEKYLKKLLLENQLLTKNKYVLRTCRTNVSQEFLTLCEGPKKSIKQISQFLAKLKVTQ